jgi:hypothetical protein
MWGSADVNRLESLCDADPQYAPTPVQLFQRYDKRLILKGNLFSSKPVAVEHVFEVMSRLCAVDLRAGHFGTEDLAQTRVGHIEAVTFGSQAGFDVLFDITASALFARTVTAVAKHCMDLPHG